MRRFATTMLSMTLAGWGGSAWAQDPAASPTPEEGEVRLEQPAAPQLDRTPKTVAVPGVPPSRKDSARAGALKGVRALSIQDGEARLLLSDGERTVRPGDTIGDDVVKTITPGRVVLTRSDASGGDALVVVSFDESGRSRVRVYLTKDPTAVVPPDVKQ